MIFVNITGKPPVLPVEEKRKTRSRRKPKSISENQKMYLANRYVKEVEGDARARFSRAARFAKEYVK